MTLPKSLLACLLLLPTLGFADGPATSGLAAALRATLANHPALAGKQAEVDASGFVVDTRRARWYPNLTGQVGYNDDSDRITSLRLDQPLWAFGKIARPIEEAEANVLAEQMSLHQLQRQLLEDTAIAYGRIEGIRAREQVSADNIAAHQSLFDHIVSRQRGKLASEADVHLARSRLLQAQAQHQAIQGELQSALHELRSLTQKNMAADLPVDHGLFQLPGASDLENEVLQKSAQAKYKRALIDVAQKAVESERSALMPTLSLRANHDVGSSTTIDDTRVSLVLEGTLEGLGKANGGRVSEARARKRAAEQDLYTVQNDLRRRVATLLSNRAVQESLVRSRQDAVQAVTATEDSYFRQYRSGHKSWLEVLNIRRELSEQRLQLAQAHNDWLITNLQLLALSGRLDSLAGLTSAHD